MKKKLLKTIKIVSTIFIIGLLIIYIVLANDCHEVKTCEEPHCIKCNSICIARTVVAILLAIYTYVVYKYFCDIYYYIIYKKYLVKVFTNTLFSQHVQFNEESII